MTVPLIRFNNMLSAQDISIRRADNVLHFADFAIQRGERLLLAGPSGSGKTTLLSIIAGFLRPDSGSVMLDQHDLYKMPTARRDRLRGTALGFVFQTLHLLPYLSVRDNILLAAKMSGTVIDEGRAADLLSAVGLHHKLMSRPNALSHGEQQRVAICRAMYNRPAVIVADEPTSALDDQNAAAIMSLLEAQANENGAALIVATHDQRIAERFERRLVLTGGEGR